jgi:hypothetical protein
MTTHTRTRYASIAAVVPGVLLLAVIGLGCNEEPPASLFDPNYVSGPTPVISAITPASGLGGVTVMTVAGLNFSTVPAYNQVVFRPRGDVEGTLLGTVLQASATSLEVKAPILAGDTIEVRVAVQGADLYSDPIFCSLASAQLEWGAFSQSDAPAGIACDVAGNVYFSNLYTGSADSVYTISPDNVQTPYSPAFSSQVPRWTGMKVGPGGSIYCVGGRNIIFEIPAGGGTVALWQRGGIGNVLDLDFDQPGNVWTAGTGTAVYSVTPAKTVTTFAIEQTSIRTIRVFGGYLYYGGTRGSDEGVWRRQILAADNLGAEELYFDYSAVYAEGFVNAITFAADGDMYVGTDGPEGIVVVHAGGASEAFYPGIVEPASVAFAWGAGTELFVSRAGGTAKATVLRIEMQKQGAPTYGRLLP